MFRIEEDGGAVRDVITRHGDEHPGRPLLQPVMKGGKRLPAAEPSLASIRRRAASELAKLPAPVRALEPCDPPYPVEISEVLRRHQATVRERVVR